MSKNPSPTLSGGFAHCLEQALEHFTDPAWLGKNSPLAAPYFLGNALAGQPGVDTCTGQGRTLQRLLREAAETLGSQGEEGLYATRLLNLSFFYPQSLLDVLHELTVSRATYYRHREEAIQRLEGAFISRVNPTLRLESPPPRAMVFGREDLVPNCLQALQGGQAVALLGPGGIGKTTLGAHLASQLAPRAVFWFTLRPGLNDQLSSLLFSLGYFLHGQGRSSLWLQLVASAGSLNPEAALSLIRYDMERPSPQPSPTGGGSKPPLFCFDEIDLLRPAVVEAHTQLLAFLESLRGLAPLLFISQQPGLEVDVQHTLAGLELGAVGQMLEQAGIQLAGGDLARLQDYTRGNPRLLELFIALHRSGECLETVLQGISAAPSLEFMLNRVWQRLDKSEQALLMSLAVFRRPAPCDAWPQTALDKLIKRRLVQTDERGGVEILPAFRATLYELLLPENREALHRQAAAIRANRGEHTAAAYHYLKGRRPQAAIRLWYEHRVHEINQGQAEAALALFGQLSRNQLRGSDRETLVLLRSELRKSTGEYGQARQDLRSTLWRTPILEARARRLEGDILEVSGELNGALTAYQEGLDTIEAQLAEAAHFHKNLGWVHMRQRNMDRAWREAQLARYEATNLQGIIQDKMGRYGQAQNYYLEALALAETLRHTQGEAKTRKNLAGLAAQQGDFDQAEVHWKRAGQYYERIGDLTNLASIKANQAFMYNMAGQHQAAIRPAEEALALFEQLGQSYGRAVAAQNLAEAHLALGELEAAERFARQVIQEEETATMPDGLRVLGEIHLARGQLQAAGDLIQQSIQVAQRNEDAFLEAYAWRALGQVRLAEGKDEQARAALDKALELFERLELSREVSKTRQMSAWTAP
ncbi:MAG: tetratricopeptide repeat protein [Thermoflexales bacterium]|nr:tetratricopeptide repeat protein [Thermoflexales bacterium]